MAKEKYTTKAPLTISLKKELKEFIDTKGPFARKTLIKPTQLIERALEEYFENHGHGEEYKTFLALEEQY